MFSPVSFLKLNLLSHQKELPQPQSAAHIPDWLIDPILLADSYQSQSSASTPSLSTNTDTFQNRSSSTSDTHSETATSPSTDAHQDSTNHGKSLDDYEKARYAVLTRLALENDMAPESVFALADFVREDKLVSDEKLSTNPEETKLTEPKHNETGQSARKRKQETTLAELDQTEIKRRAIALPPTENSENKIHQAYLQRAKKACEMGITMRDYRKIIHALQLKNPNMTDEEKAEWGITEEEAKGRLNENTGLSAVEIREKHRQNALSKVGLSRSQERNFGLSRQMQRLGIKDSSELAALRKRAKSSGLTLEQLCRQEWRVRPMSDEAVRLLQMASSVKQSNKDRYQNSLLRCGRLGLKNDKELRNKRKEAQAQGLTVEKLVSKEREAKALNLGITVEELLKREGVSRHYYRSPFVRIEQCKPGGTLLAHFKMSALKNTLPFKLGQQDQRVPINPFVQIEESRPNGPLLVRFNVSALKQRLQAKDFQAF